MSREVGSARQLHEALPAPSTRQVRVRQVVGPAAVLGSAQPDIVDHDRAAAAGADVVRRRTGGGLVWLDDSEPLWVELCVPVDDPLWMADVGRSSLWLGRAWQRALEAAGVVAAVHDGPLVRDPWTPLLCFAGLAPGEVTVRGQKVVGIAQRRTREGAIFQCAAYRRFDPAPLLQVLAPDAGPGQGAAAALDRAAGTGVPPDDLLAALLAVLP